MTEKLNVPDNLEAEQCLLGAILVNNAAYDRVSGTLRAEHFTEPLHRKIFEIAGELIRMGKAVTPITIKTFLPADDKVGDMTVAQYLVRLARNAVNVVLAPDYAAAVREVAARRKLIVELDSALRVLQHPEVRDDPMDSVRDIAEVCARLLADDDLRPRQGGIGRAYLESLTAANKHKAVNGVAFGIAELQEVISEPSFEAGNLYGLLSSSGEGKTSFTLQVMSNAIQAGHPTLFLSYDQSADQCMRQMVAQRFDVTASRQRNGDISEWEAEKAVDFASWIDRQPFDIQKCTDQRAGHLVSLARSFVKRHGNGKVPLIVVDHIGAITPEDDRADEGTKAKGINKILKAGAEQTQGAFLVLNQRNSRGMMRVNPRPIGADLFGGDPAKQAYDAIFYLYRFKKFYEDALAVASRASDYAAIDKVYPSEVRLNKADIAEIGSIKCRFGSPYERRRMNFRAEFTRYESIADERAPNLMEGSLL
jgi:replicative DNA helicase